MGNINNLTPEEFFEELENSYYVCKKIDNIDIITNCKLPVHHKDPFDRFLIWESIRNDFILDLFKNLSVLSRVHGICRKWRQIPHFFQGNCLETEVSKQV
jgi:hypothetical protein